MSGRLLRRLRLQDGAAAVEFGLLLPLIVILLGGIIDFGLALNAQISLTQAAREGVRIEVFGGDGEQAAIDAFIAPAATVVNTSTDECPPGPPGPDDRATITILADYDPFFLAFLPIPDPLTMKGEAVMRCGG